MPISRLAVIVCLLSASLSPIANAGSNLRLFFVPAGTDPTTATPGETFETTASGGTSITVEAFADDGEVQEYTVAWPCDIPSDLGNRPAITYVPETSNVSTLNPDYVFNGAPGFAAVDDGQCDTAFGCVAPTECPGNSTCVDNLCTVVNPRTGAVAFFPVSFAGQIKYLGDVTFDIPADAGGTYTLLPFCTPDDGCPLTFTNFDSGDDLFDVDPLDIIIPVGDCCVGADCTPDVTESECNDLGGTFRAGGDCSENCACMMDSDCDDGNACTADICAGATTCSDGSTPDAAGCCNVDQTPPGLCCNIETGNIVDPDDNNPCTEDACDANGMAMQTPLPDGPNAGCDDGGTCTTDECVNGDCVNTNIAEIACTDVDDCPSAASSCDDGFCVCVENPSLCINPLEASGDQVCVGAGDTVTFDVDTGFSTSIICGAQLFLQYDAEALELIDIIEGADTGNPNSEVFNTLLFASFDPVIGTIDYAIGDLPTGNCDNGTNGPATIARFVFRAVGDCLVEDALCFRENNPETTLGSATGLAITPAACDDVSAPVAGTCSPDVNIIETSDVACPFDGRVVVPADCGTKKATIEFDPITITNSCEGEIIPDCTLNYYPPCTDNTDCGGAECGTINPGFCDAPVTAPNTCNNPALAETGGAFCRGLTTISCQATSACTGKSVCSFEIENNGMNEVIADVELSPTLIGGSPFDPLVRCLEFNVSRCGSIGEIPTIVNAEIELGQPGDIAGHGTAVFEVPAGNWECITARDPWHSLGSSCQLECVDNVYRATFKGAPDFAECSWLTNGNLNGDDVIDILDFVTFMSINDQQIDPDTTCDMMPPTDDGEGQKHGDINGDGVIDLLDFSFIAINFFKDDKSGCDQVCGIPTSPALRTGPRTEVSVRELIDRGFSLRFLQSIDINSDQKIDLTDVTGAISTP